MKIAVLIPAYDEVLTVASVVKEFQQLLPDAEIYVFDNNSSDGTAQAAKNAGAIVVPEPRQGKGNVIRSMFRSVDADVYLMADADHTLNPEDVVALAEPIISKTADMVIGDRLSANYFDANTYPLNSLGNRIVRYFINLIFGAEIRDVMTGARAFSREFAKTCPILSSGFEVETEMTIHALDKQWRIEQMPVRYSNRLPESTRKLNTLRDGARVIKTILALFKDFQPLWFFGLASSALLTGAVILSVGPLGEYVNGGYVYRVPSLVVAVALGISALLSAVAGVILDSIRKQSRTLYELHLTARGETELSQIPRQADVPQNR